MAKSESPVLRMTVQNGRLSPATAFDQERLLTYRNGSEVRVRITQERNAKLLRKFFAIVGRVVKDCKTPWKTKDQAVEALKLALGIVETGKTIGGNWFQYPRSLTELDEPEFAEFYEQAMAVLHEVTGVDPLTLGAESADVGEDEPEPSSIETGDDAGSGEASSASPAADPSTAVAADPGAGGTGEADGPASPPAPDLSAAEVKWLRGVARMLWACTGKGEQDRVEDTAKAFIAEIPTDIGKAARDKATGIRKQCKLVCFGEATVDDARKMVAALSGVAVEELREVEA